MGIRIKGGEVEQISPDGKLLAVYDRWDLGAKGRLYGINTLPDADYWEARIPVITFKGRKYHVVQYCDDYAELMSEFFREMNDKKSAYHCA